MKCPHCLACRGVHGDVGGAEDAEAIDRDRRLLGKLCKYRRVRSGSFVVQICYIGGCAVAASELQWLAFVVRAQYPGGILLVHEDLRACFHFTATSPPRLVSVACCLRLLRSGCAAGLVLLRGRVRWLSVRRNI